MTIFKFTKLSIPHSRDYYHIHIIFLLLFLYGYFQRSTFTNVGITDDLIIENAEGFTSPKYDRLVFIVIDALREDFVTSSLMPFTYRAASTNNCLFQVKVSAPTVTLPRIKTLTTGTVPQYFDMIGNLWVSKSESGTLNNSFLHSAKGKGRRMVFYGDDTWLHLYPNLFVRSDGTNSMFVNDFYEVDNNVTSNVLLELADDNWDFMFLHYLGLDHIGHVEGPKSNLVPSKLLEMDSVISLLFDHMLLYADVRTLILVTGDHGMRDSGGHGGTSFAETHVPLVLLGEPCNFHADSLNEWNFNDENILNNLSYLHRINIQQSDIPTTISILFGLPVPSDSVGKFVPEFYSGLDLQERYYFCLYINQMLFGYPAPKTFENFNLTMLSDCEIKLIESTNKISDSGGNVFLLLLCAFVQIVLILKSITSLSSKCIDLKFLKKYLRSPYFISIVVMFGHSLLLLCSTSYVEEEHQIHYYFFVTALILLIYNCKNNKHIFADALILVSFRFIKCLNQTGDQFASRPDLVDWFLQADYYIYSHLFLFGSFIFLMLVSKKIYRDKIYLQSFFAVLTGNIVVYKVFYYNNNSYAQMLWICIFLLAIINYFNCVRKYDSVLVFWICISSLVTRPHNLILIPYTIFLSSYFCDRIGKSYYQIILHIVLGQTMYFCSGFSNSLASVDVASGYIGITSYDPILVTIIVLCNTYCLPIMSQLLVLRNCDFNAKDILLVNAIDRMLTACLICITAIIHIQHLFVWSVFAPKLLIESCHCVILWIFLISYELLQLFKKHFIIKC